MWRAVTVVAVALTSILGVGSPAGAQDESTAAEAAVVVAFERLEASSTGASFGPAADPSVDDEGEPNPILRTSIATLDLGRPVEAGDLAVRAGLGIEELNAGDGGFVQNQVTLTSVMVELAAAPGEGPNPIENVSLAFTYAGQAVLTDSAFANDPLLGFGAVIDRGVANGEAFTGYQQVVDGSFQPFADPIATYSFRTATGYVIVWLVPGVPDQVAVISSHAAQGIPEALYFARADLPPVTVFVDPASVTDLEPLTSLVTDQTTPAAEFDSGLCAPLGGSLETGTGTCTVTNTDENLCLRAGGSVATGTCTLIEPLDQTTCTAVSGTFDTSTEICTTTLTAESPTDTPAEFDSGLCAPLGGSLETGTGTCTVTNTDENLCLRAGGSVATGTCTLIEPLDQTTCTAVSGTFDTSTEICTTTLTAEPAEVPSGQAEPTEGGDQDDSGAGTNPVAIIVPIIIGALVVGYLAYRWLRRDDGTEELVPVSPTPPVELNEAMLADASDGVIVGSLAVQRPDDPPSVRADFGDRRLGDLTAMMVGEAKREGAPSNEAGWLAPSYGALYNAELHVGRAEVHHGRYEDPAAWSQEFVNEHTGHFVTAEHGERWEELRVEFGLERPSPPIEENPTIEFGGDEDVRPT